VLDPVYSGKAVHCLLQDMSERPQEWRGKRVLFVHTGGLLVRASQLQVLHIKQHSAACEGEKEQTIMDSLGALMHATQSSSTVRQ
jgi:hypothetical protein